MVYTDKYKYTYLFIGERVESTDHRGVMSFESRQARARQSSSRACRAVGYERGDTTDATSSRRIEYQRLEVNRNTRDDRGTRESRRGGGVYQS